MEKTVYLFRHGKPEEALQGRCRGGDTHCDLSNEGVLQTRGNVEYLLSRHSTDDVRQMHVVTSGMERSDFFGRELAAHGVRHSIDSRLRTIAAGEWEGLSWDDIQERWPEQYELAMHRGQLLEMPGGEAVSAFRQRVREAFRDCLAIPSTHIVIVGHGCTNDVILADAEQREDLHFRDQPIGCMNRIDVDAAGRMRVIDRKSIVYDQRVCARES